ncbi:PRC-barrel domain containing protein [Terracoccus sp. 273MFTsu3.1]|uniref:PRC-barrel domain containing protein n=1 Tax=Terracoccus sp. 273MFTsu3.1 TaxID=1172188 RepID=UPI001E5914CB|nr:PRC-barrel domain containing protein [Terracoccus sp. 273MFTsu3.1]
MDGDIGKIDAATREVGADYVVVDTGPWIFGRKVMLPAGTVERVDWDDNSVYVDRTKDQIKDSPEMGEDVNDRSYCDRLGTYYGDTYDERNPL